MCAFFTVAILEYDWRLPLLPWARRRRRKFTSKKIKWRNKRSVTFGSCCRGLSVNNMNIFERSKQSWLSSRSQGFASGLETIFETCSTQAPMKLSFQSVLKPETVWKPCTSYNTASKQVFGQQLLKLDQQTLLVLEEIFFLRILLLSILLSKSRYCLKKQFYDSLTDQGPSRRTWPDWHPRFWLELACSLASLTIWLESATAARISSCSCFWDWELIRERGSWASSSSLHWLENNQAWLTRVIFLRFGITDFQL